MPDFVYDIPSTQLAALFSLVAVGAVLFGLLVVKPVLRIFFGTGPDFNQNVSFGGAGFNLFYGLLLGLLDGVGLPEQRARAAGGAGRGHGDRVALRGYAELSRAHAERRAGAPAGLHALHDLRRLGGAPDGTDPRRGRPPGGGDPAASCLVRAEDRRSDRAPRVDDRRLPGFHEGPAGAARRASSPRSRTCCGTPCWWGRW